MVFVGMLALHVLAGLTAAGAATAACLARKRPGIHPRWGRVYLYALAAVTATAIGMAAIRWPQDAHLAAIAATAAALAGAGWWARRRHRPGWPARHAIGLGGSFAAMLTGFYVDNGPRLPLWDRLPHAAYWLLPSAVAAVLIRRALRRFTAGSRTRPR